MIILKRYVITTKEAVETVQSIQSHFYKREYDKFIGKALVYCSEKVRIQNKAEVFIELLKKCLFCVHNDKLLYDKHYSETINVLGIISYFKFNFSTAINYYYLAIMASSQVNQWKYYHNIADALNMSGEFDLAEQYFKQFNEIIQKPEETNYTDEFRNYLTGIGKLNYVDCLIRKKKIELAREIFSTIQPQEHFDEETKELYSSRKVMLNLDKEANCFSKVIQLKEDLLSKEMFMSVLVINELLIHYGVSISEYEKVLLENIEVSNKIPSLELRKQTRIDIIKFYKSQNDPKAELEHLNALFELNTLVKSGTHGVLQEIFNQEISVFIGGLRKKNTTISSQKKELEEITYILSHDLKTPLRIISSFSDLAQRKAAKKEYQDMDEYLGLIKESSKNLHELVEDVNTLHSVEQHNDIHKSIDLNIVMSEVIKMLQPHILEKNATVKVKGQLPVLQGVDSNFFIVFKNLIENGLKYNESEHPRITIFADTNERVTKIFFKDNGLGIEEEYHEYIFLYFKRLHNREKYEGTGFGLGICKKIINDLNGTIRVESKLGEGSTFIIQLPLAYS